jgi:alanyl aminopeptidase
VALAKSAGCPAWVVPNAGATGYYRTSWTAAQLATLALEKLSAAERLQLVYDVATLKKAGLIDPSEVLAKLSKDSEPEIVKAAADALK